MRTLKGLSYEVSCLATGMGPPPRRFPAENPVLAEGLMSLTRTHSGDARVCRPVMREYRSQRTEQGKVGMGWFSSVAGVPAISRE